MEVTLAHRQDVEVPTPSKYSRDPILSALGMVTRKRRLAIKLSQEHLAALAELDCSYLGQIERGENSVAIHSLVRIANALNTSAAELFTDAGL